MDINRPLSFARISFGGKEIAGKKVSVSTGAPAAAAGSPYLDFGARVYDPRTAAWLSQDPLSEKYYSISPYAYCAGNPVNLLDATGTVIRDKDGNIVYYTNGDTAVFEHPSGGRALLEIGFVFADSGSPIMVFNNIGKDKGWDTNCHGVSFTGGQYWLNNDQVSSLLKEDKYEVVNIDDAKVGDIIIYHGDSYFEHSMTITKTDGTLIGTEVYGQGGLEVENHTDNANEAWKRPTNSTVVRKNQLDRIATNKEIRQLRRSIQQ